MPVIRRTLTGANQFVEGDPTSVFGFANRSNLPRSTGILIGLVGYFEARDDADLTTDVQAWLQLAGGDPTDRVPLDIGQASENLLNPITGNAEMRLCGVELPREPGTLGQGGQFWDVVVATQNKTETATVTVQYRIVPGPESALNDSTDRVA